MIRHGFSSTHRISALYIPQAFTTQAQPIRLEILELMLIVATPEAPKVA